VQDVEVIGLADPVQKYLWDSGPAQVVFSSVHPAAAVPDPGPEEQARDKGAIRVAAKHARRRREPAMASIENLSFLRCSRTVGVLITDVSPMPMRETKPLTAPG
jgi:hypothetical protein